MATFQVSNKEKKKSSKNVKVITGWTLLATSTFIFLFSVTNILPFLRVFFLGLFGVFVYPLTLVGMIVSLALLNNKKYVMPRSYAVCLMLSLYFLLAIIQLIILGVPGEMSYGEYVGLNYSKQMTAGGMLIGFIPSTLMYLMGTAATYIVFALALITSSAFFIQAYLSIKKTKQAEKPIKLQIKEKTDGDTIEERRDSKVFQKEVVEEQAVEETPVNVMFEGYHEQEQEKQKSARELLGLVGGNKPIVTMEEYKSHQMELPKPKEEEEGIPKGMSMREYLLSPPKVDLEKFRQQQNKMKSYSNYFINQKSQSASSINLDASEIDKNINDVKDIDDISIESENIQTETNNFMQSNLTEVKPEEITSEAEDIIKMVVEQEKRERGEEIHLESVDAEEVAVEDLNQFIDFDDVEEKPTQPQRPIELGDRRQEFSRDLSRGDDFSRRNEMPSRNENFERNRDNVLENRDRAIKPQHNDEMQRRREFVQVEQEKKSEVIKPYKYTKPPLELITTQSDDPASFNAEMTQKSVALENALEKFGIPAKVQSVVIGPTVTRYEIEMPEGISVKRILSLDADIAYALCAEGQIRIEAPVPGRSVVGIEVPNKKIATVSIKDVLSSKEFNLSPSPLTFALGKDITGGVKVCNLQKMPHLLVAGTTGSGKSVCLNTIITSIIYKSSPDEVKFIMIDPKQVELSMYEGLPHMIVPRVITDPTKAVNALGWAVEEMERRFRLISEARVRDIQEYNKTDSVVQLKAKKMPFIVIIFDEFADFMQVAKNEIEDKIRRLAGKARAAGIHLILATQRPSTDVVTGTLKGNLPARIAFKVASRVDSEVILGSTGAEKLLGKGDMLYRPDSESKRIQGCYIATEETKQVVNFIVEHNEETFDPEAVEYINNPNKNKNGGNGDNGKDGVDPLMVQALKICIDNGVASTTMVQRKLSIGYPRAARLIDLMEERGYISSADGAKQRSVYITIEEFYSIFGDVYD